MSDWSKREPKERASISPRRSLLEYARIASREDGYGSVTRLFEVLVDRYRTRRERQRRRAA